MTRLAIWFHQKVSGWLFKSIEYFLLILDSEIAAAKSELMGMETF